MFLIGLKLTGRAKSHRNCHKILEKARVSEQENKREEGAAKVLGKTI